MWSGLATPGYDLKLTVDRVPFPSVLRLVRLTKKGLPSDLVATGQLDAVFLAQCASTGPPAVSGAGAASDLRLALNGGKTRSVSATFPSYWLGARRRQPCPRAQEQSRRPGTAGSPPAIGPFPLGWALPRPPRLADALAFWLSLLPARRHGTEERISPGQCTGRRRTAPDGRRRCPVDLSLAGPWQGFAAPAPTGTAQLHNVRAGCAG